MPTCKRERELAASHTSALDVMPGTGVAVNSLRGVTVGERRGVAVSDGAGVDDGVFVGVGDEIGIAVAVAVTDGRASCEVDVDVGFTAPVDGGEAETAGALAGVEERAPAGESGVEVSDLDAGIAG